MDSSAAEREPRVTKPNPRGREVPRSMGRKTSVTVPKAPNTSRRRGSSVAVGVGVEFDIEMDEMGCERFYIIL